MVIGIILFVIAAVLFWLGPLCTEKEKEKEKERFGQAIFLAHQHYIEDLIPSLNIYFSIVVNNTLFGLAPFEKAGSNEILVNLQYSFPPKLGAMALATGLQNLVQEMFNRRFELPDNYPAALSNTLKDIKEHKYPVVIMSDVGSRGIDISDVTHILNIDFPSDMAYYFHRVGRTARHLECGKAYTFVNRDEDEKEILALS